MTQGHIYHDEDPRTLMERLIEVVHKWEDTGASALGVMLLYSGRNRLYRVTSDHGEYVVKSFGKVSLWRRLYYSYIGTTKARRAHLSALELEARVSGAAPESYGYLEERNVFGLIGYCYYVSAYIEATELDIHPHMRGWTAPPDMLRQLGGFIARLHEAGVEHLDLSPGNILYHYDRVTGLYHFVLVDLNRMRFCPRSLTLVEGAHNVDRLPSCPSVTNRLANHYADERGWLASEVEQAWSEACDRFWLKRLPKLAYRWGRRRGLGASRLAFACIYIWYQILVRLGRWSWLGTWSIGAKRRAEEIYQVRLRGEDIRHALRRRWEHTLGFRPDR